MGSLSRLWSREENMLRCLVLACISAAIGGCPATGSIGSRLDLTYSVLNNDNGKFIFRINMTNNSPHDLAHNSTIGLEYANWEFHFSHVYGIDDYMAALDGVKLVDYVTNRTIGLTLYRFGGFYWKFMTNEVWEPLRSGGSFSFTLVGNNWMSSSSDVFNNW